MTRPFLALAAMTAALMLVLATGAGVASAADCGTAALSATNAAGRSIDVTGSGWPADAAVSLAILRDGAEDSSQALVADASGSFGATIPAGPGRGGAYTLIATSGACKAVVDVVAVETAGGLPGRTAPAATPPATDTVPVVRPASGRASGGGPSEATLVAAIALAGVLAAAAVVGLIRGGSGRPAPR